VTGFGLNFFWYLYHRLVGSPINPAPAHNKCKSFKTKKNILNIISALLLLSWVSFIYLHFFHFQSIAPTKPNPATGQIYKVNNHGWIFYLTREQELVTFSPFGIAIISLIVLALLEWRWKIYKQIYGQ
jgi:hypothetical protein